MASPGVASVMMDAAQALLLQGNAAVPPSQTAGSTSINQGMHRPNASSCVSTASTTATSPVEEGRGRTVSAENEMMETDTHACSGISAAQYTETGTSCAGTITSSTGNPPAARGGDFASSDALDALAALASATSEVRNASVDEDDDDDAALHEEERHDTLGPLITSRSPSPEQIKSSGSFGSASRPRRMMGRLRSVSNPEGMEKWDSMGRSNMAVDHSATSHRRHFVLPSSILEEELADAQMAVDRGLGRRYRAYSGQFSDDPHHHPYVEDEPDYMDAAPLRISPDMSAEATLDETEESEDEEGEEEEGSEGDEEDGGEEVEAEEEEEEEDEDTSNLSPEELLRRARARLLEDVSTANGGPAGTSVASRGVLPLPHSLGKYKNVSYGMKNLGGHFIFHFVHDIHMTVSHITEHFLLSSFNMTGVQQERTDWHLHPRRACGHHCPVPVQASAAQLEEEDPVRLSQVFGRPAHPCQRTLRQA